MIRKVLYMTIGVLLLVSCSAENNPLTNATGAVDPAAKVAVRTVFNQVVQMYRVSLASGTDSQTAWSQALAAGGGIKDDPGWQETKISADSDLAPTLLAVSVQNVCVSGQITGGSPEVKSGVSANGMCIEP